MKLLIISDFVSFGYIKTGDYVSSKRTGIKGPHWFSNYRAFVKTVCLFEPNPPLNIADTA